MNRLHPLLLATLLFSLSLMAQASDALRGQFLYHYEGGTVYRVTFMDAGTLRWHCLQGDEKGAQGTEKPDRFHVAKNVYFLSWVEKNGIQVSQVLNLNTMHVYSTIIDGQSRYVISGRIQREK